MNIEEVMRPSSLEDLSQEQLLFLGSHLCVQIDSVVKTLKKKGINITTVFNKTLVDLMRELAAMHGLGREDYNKMSPEGRMAFLDFTLTKLCSEDSWNEINKVLEGTEEMAA